MKYKDLISFEPLESLIQLTDANEKEKAINLVNSYVMSDSMAEILNDVVLPQLQFEKFHDNKGIFIVGNYGTGKSHLMSVISSIAEDKELLKYVDNEEFKNQAQNIAGKFEVLRIEIGSVTTSLRDIILKREIESDLKKRGIDFTFPDMNEITNNKETLIDMMAKFEEKYPDKGYLIVIDEILDYLKTKKEHDLILDLGFLRELGEVCKNTRIRIIAGLQESLFDSPKFSHVKDKIMQIRDRYENIVIRREDIAFVVSKRLLKKDNRQKALIRNHLEKFTYLYSNMINRLENFVELYPIHPSYIEVFQNIYIAEKRQILKTLSMTIRNILEEDVPENSPGIISYDSYYEYIKDMTAARTDVQIREVIDKSRTLENIINSSYTRPIYKKYALKIINALSVHRLTTGDIYSPIGITADNIKDDLCLFIPEAPELDEEFLKSAIETIIKEIIKTVSGQFISYNMNNGQYYLDLKKVVDYQAKIEEKAEILDDDYLNQYYYNIILKILEWDEYAATPYVPGHKIWEYKLLWREKNIERYGYLFFGNPNERSTAHPPRDFYIYFSKIFETSNWEDNKNDDEIFFSFNMTDDIFTSKLRLYAAANELSEASSASSSDKKSYTEKANAYQKDLTKYIKENILKCFTVKYKGESKTIQEIFKHKAISGSETKIIIDSIASEYFSKYFNNIYPNYPKFNTVITLGRGGNLEQITKAAFNYIAGKKDELGFKILDSLELLDGSKVYPYNSKYAKYYVDLILNTAPGMVINKKDIININKSEEEVDKKFNFEINFTLIVLASLIHSGDIILTDGQGNDYDSTKLQELSSCNFSYLLDFKYIKRPKDIPIDALVELFTCFDIPAGHIKNPSNRDEGIIAMQNKKDKYIQNIFKIKELLTKGIFIWDFSPLNIDSKKDNYIDKLNKLREFLDSLAIYNTTSKLKTFKYTKEEVKEKCKAINILNEINTVIEFKNKLDPYINYLQNAENLIDDKEFKDIIKNIKDKLKTATGDINKMQGEFLNEIENYMEKAKNKYIEIYMEEHKKYRLNVNEDDLKKKIISGKEFENLKKLCQIKDLFNIREYEDIKEKLSQALTCFDLTIDELKRQPICPHCNFIPVKDRNVLVYGLMDEIENKINKTLKDWTERLLRALDDNIIRENMKYLKGEEKKEIEEFIKNKNLPDRISVNFINAVNELMEGFEKVEIELDKFKYEFAKGPATIDEFKAEIDRYINNLIKGKQKEKIRIFIK